MSQALSTDDSGATVVITHRIRSDKHAEYESWLGEIAPLCNASPGHLDWHIVRPIKGITQTYTVIIRFDTADHLKKWMSSSERKRLISKVQPLLAGVDEFYISSGLDFSGSAAVQDRPRCRPQDQSNSPRSNTMRPPMDWPLLSITIRDRP